MKSSSYLASTAPVNIPNPGRFIDITGKRFGRWTVLELHPVRRRRRTVWFSRCDCGTERLVLGTSLRTGTSTNCGCFRRERLTAHGLWRTRVYNVWVSMLQRCFNPNNRAYADYGGRGITACERWHTFENFLADMGEPPPGLSLDRINNDGNYEPGNCRWATRTQQSLNQRKRKRRRSTLADIQAYAASLTRAASRPAARGAA